MNDTNSSLHDHRLGLIYRSQKFGIPDSPKTNDPRVSRLHGELEAVWKDWASLVESAVTITNDATAPEDLRKLRVLRLANSKTTKVAERALDAIRTAEIEIARIEKQFSAQLEPTSAASEMRRATLRQSLASLPDSKRTEVVRDAIRNGDRAMLDAISSGHRFESGVIAAHYGEARAKLFELSQPGDHAVLGAMREGVSKLQNAAGNFATSARDDVVPFDAAAVEVRAKAANEAATGGASGHA